MSKHIVKQYDLPLSSPWKRREVDKMLDLYFDGVEVSRIARKIERDADEVSHKLQEYFYNQHDRAVNYKPKRRISRKGKPLTDNDRLVIVSLQKANVASEHIARILCRPVSDFAAPSKTLEFKSSLPTLDLILALRYLFHCRKKKIVTDEEYDALVQEEREFGTGAGILDHQTQADYFLPRIGPLADYLQQRAVDEVKLQAESWKDLKRKPR